MTDIDAPIWRDGAFRLHDRFRFTRLQGGWAKARLYP